MFFLVSGMFGSTFLRKIVGKHNYFLNVKFIEHVYCNNIITYFDVFELFHSK